MDEPLDNPIWHALTGPQAGFGRRLGEAARFVRTAAPFFAIAAPTAAAYADLAQLLEDAPEARLFRPVGEPVPLGWSETFAKEIVQMVCAAPLRARDAALDGAIEPLGPADVDAMMALAAAANPGPFGPRTVQLGRFVGIRVDGMLAAMAGERLLLPGHVELSAICTHPAQRGRGLARALVCSLAAVALARGETPFLHVFPDNAAAAGLYRRLGFVERRRLLVRWLVRARGG